MRLLTLLLVSAFILSSCSDNRNNFKVEISVNGSDGGIIYLAKRTVSGSFVVDSTMPGKSGKYELTGYTEQPDFYVVYHNPGTYINLIIHPGDDFRVLTDATSFDRHYIVEGSSDSRLIQKVVNMQVRTLEKITQLTDRYESSRNSSNFDILRKEIDSLYEQAFTEHKNFSVTLIEENPRSLASLMTLYQQLGRNAPVFDYKKDFKYYSMVDSSLSNLYPNSEAVIDLNRKVTELRGILRLEPGSPAPELSLPDSSGNIVKLSSLKGRYVVLFFWASWSSKSITDLNRLQSLYNQLNDEAEYYQVSLDRTHESWLRNISENGIHVSDLRYWDSPVVQSYFIEKLPVVLLIDPTGKIVERDFNIDELPRLLENK